MSHRGFPGDGALASRMAIVIFLLGLVYVAFIAALIALGVPTITIILVVGGFFLLQYYLSDRIALFSLGAHEVTAEEAPQLHGVVDRLCTLADMPKPRIAVAQNDMPNAFATGRSQKNSVLCVTTGLMRRLDESELEGVLGHELSHVAHRDVIVMTIASFLGLLAGLITRSLMYTGMYGGFGGGRRGRDEDRGAAMIMAVILVSAVVYAISFFLTRALSRYRELSADRSAAILTGRPSTLASALVKVTGEMAAIPTRDLRNAEPLNAFFFVPALASGFSLSSLFASHPSLETRLAQLAQIEAELARAG
ncbi:MAG: zinc metalloprotease HtpX [Candidatus Limnocylindria bacterium]